MKAKYFLVIFLALVCVVPVYSAYSVDSADADLVFEDVDQDHENFDAIDFLFKAGIVAGYLDEESGERSYRPEQDINRAEFLKILLGGTEDQIGVPDEKCFPDVSEDAWYAPYVCFAKISGLVSGYEDGTFRPETPVNEAEALRITGEIFGWAVNDLEDGDPWYKPCFDYAKNANLIESDDVSAPLDRGDMAELVFRSIEVGYFALDAFSEDFVDDLFGALDDVVGNVVDDGDTDGGDAVDEDGDTGDTDDAGDTVDGADTASDVSELKVYVPSSSSASDEEKFDIEVEVYGKDGELLSGRDLAIVVSTGIDFSEDLPVTEEETGHYKTSFGSVLAGTYNLFVTDSASGLGYETTFEITPLDLGSVEIIDTVSPPVDGELDKGYVRIVGRDIYGNILPYSSGGNNLSAITSLGEVTQVSHDDSGVFTVEITSDELGTANVAVIDEIDESVFAESSEISFLSVQLDMPKGIDVNNTSQIDVPVYIFFPESLGDLYSYDLTLAYDPETLAFSSVEDPDLSDGFDVPSIEVDEENGRIFFSQMRKETDVAAREQVEVSNFKMNVIGVGAGAVYVDSGSLTNTDGEEGFVDGVINGLVKWWYNIKDTKDFCVDIFTMPGSNITQQKINQDIARANLTYAQVADSCNCDYYLNFSVHSVTDLDAAKWGAVDANGDNDLDIAELNGLMTNYPPTGSCIPAYYPPAIDGGDLGWTWSGGNVPMGVAIDNNKDPDNRTLAHEFAHYLSHRGVEDPGNPPDSTSQGADTVGNLMNYNNTGDELTEDQCELIEKYFN